MKVGVEGRKEGLGGMKCKSEKKRDREGRLKNKKEEHHAEKPGKMQREALSRRTARVLDNRRCQY